MKNEFYNLLAIECGFSSISSVQQFYNGLLRFVKKELRREGVVELPGIGKFELRQVGKNKPYKFKGRVVEPYKALKFVPNRQLKEETKLW